MCRRGLHTSCIPNGIRGAVSVLTGIIMAWHYVSAGMFVKVLKKCCISTALDGSDNMHNDSKENGNGNSKCEEDHYTLKTMKE